MNSQFKDLESGVDISSNKYPYSLVWTALPGLTCCCPCIGHVGVCKSDGTIYDFIGAGPTHSEELAFGDPLKYLVLDHSSITDQQWDAAIDQANYEFSLTDHNLCCNNCHHHVVRALNIMNYKGKNNWNQVDLAAMATFKGSHTGCKSLIIYVLPIIFIIWMIVKNTIR